MNSEDFSLSVPVACSSQALFDAINNVRGWWSEDIQGDTAGLHAEFRYQYRDVHRCRIEVMESVPGRRVAWVVRDNHFSFTQDKTEWIGTEIVFEIGEAGAGCLLHFTHKGLGKAYECYNVCEEAWTNYIGTSLRLLAETGAGTPNPAEGGYNAELADKWSLEA